MAKKMFLIVALVCLFGSIALIGCAQTPSSIPEPTTPETSAPAPAPAQEPVKLKAIQFLGMDNAGAKPFQTLIERINEAAAGKLVIDIAGGPETIPQLDQAEALKTGAVDVAYTPWAYFRSMVPIAGSVNMIRLDQKDQLPGTPWYDFCVSEFEKQGIRIICEGAFASPFYLYANKEAKKPDDLKGVRMRTSAAFPFLEAINITPITLEHEDIYTAIERNLIDGCVNKNTSFVQDGLCGVLDYRIGPGFWGLASIPVSMNGQVWNDLPAELQDLIINEVLAYFPIKQKGNQAFIDVNAEKVIECGVQNVEWSDADSKWMRDSIDGYMFERAAKSMSPELLATYKKLGGFE